MCQFQDFDLEMKSLKQVLIFLNVFVVFALAAPTLDESLEVSLFRKHGEAENSTGLKFKARWEAIKNV